jgi:hypothetical protein
MSAVASGELAELKVTPIWHGMRDAGVEENLASRARAGQSVRQYADIRGRDTVTIGVLD